MLTAAALSIAAALVGCATARLHPAPSSLQAEGQHYHKQRIDKLRGIVIITNTTLAHSSACLLPGGPPLPSAGMDLMLLSAMREHQLQAGASGRGAGCRIRSGSNPPTPVHQRAPKNTSHPGAPAAD